MIEVKLDREKWTRVMDGRWEIWSAQPLVSHNYSYNNACLYISESIVIYQSFFSVDKYKEA